jgi:peptidoglycan hydrolase-like protein with peptidoglycan-binding domain
MKILILAGVSAIALAVGGTGMSYAAGAGDNASSSMSSGSHAGQQAAMSRDEVKQAQQKLKAEGLYNGQIDGIDGPETKQALQQFQQKNGLQQTGTLDQETLSALMGNQTTGAGSSMPPSSHGTQGTHGSSMNPGTSNQQH